MRLKTENTKLKSANYYLKRKGCEQDLKVSDLTSLLKEVQGQYRYARTQLLDALPHEKTITTWCTRKMPVYYEKLNVSFVI